MLTTQHLSTWKFWNELRGDGRWTAFLDGKGRPTDRTVARLLGDYGVRHADKKARCLMKAWRFNHQFADLAGLMQDTLRSVHDAGAPPTTRRVAELVVASRVQSVLAGCNVGPKVARLMLLWNPGTDQRDPASFCQVIPLDSKWQAELTELGADLTSVNLNNEASYREVEDVLCEACFAAGVAPGLLDAHVFDSR